MTTADRRAGPGPVLPDETFITADRAVGEIPRRDGQLIPVRRVESYMRVGVRGVKLESWLVGGRRCTSVEAVRRFLARLNGLPVNDPAAPGPGPAA